MYHHQLNLVLIKEIEGILVSYFLESTLSLMTWSNWYTILTIYITGNKPTLTNSLNEITAVLYFSFTKQLFYNYL